MFVAIKIAFIPPLLVNFFCLFMYSERHVRFLPQVCESAVKVALFVFFAGVSPLSALGGDGETGKVTLITKGITASDGLGYYLLDWGDGFLTASALRRDEAPVTLGHRWIQAGNYDLQLTRQSLAGSVAAQPLGDVIVTGEAWEPDQKAGEQFFSSGKVDDGVWSSASGSQRLREEWIAVKLPEETPLEALWIDSKNCPNFPSAFRVEYSLDAGKTWLRIPTAVFFRFPNPEGKTVEIPLHNLVANAVRVVVPIMSEGGDEDWKTQVGNLRVVSGTEPLFSWNGGVSGPESAAWNNLWTIYGEATSEVKLDNSTWLQSQRPFEGGVAGFASAEWMEWISLKFAWRNNEQEQQKLRRALLDMVVDEDGFVWACPVDPRHLNHSRHYTTNASFINAVSNFFLWTRDREFLTAPHGAQQESLLNRARRAMDYQLENLDGASGVLTIKDPDNDGTSKGLPDNYWDFWRFGYQTAYGNVLFYSSLLQMAELEEALGEGARADKLRELAILTKKRFNEVFWNEGKGRYIGGIDVEGVHRDYGFVFVNIHAVAAGIAPADRARRIMDWVSGTRNVSEEESTGQDIYHFGIAPRSTTISASEGEPWYETWGGALKTHEGGNAAYGVQMQNGGAIFYVSYYDLLARGRVLGVNDAWQRMQMILEEFQIDQLRRDPSGPEAMTEIIGVVGEFPESGLVPLALLPVWLGAEVKAGGLSLAPRLPDSWQEVTVRGIRFAGQPGEITVGKNILEAALQQENGRWHLSLPATGTHLFTPEFKLQ